jgi:hypothetical protein
MRPAPTPTAGTLGRMSVSVDLASLREEIDRHGSVAFFLTVGSDGRPHSVQLVVDWAEPDQLVVHPGNSTVANAVARPLVSVLWPPTEPGGYSLIVDATVTESSGTGDGDNTVSVQPTKAVLHRPAKSDDTAAGAHGSDCVRVFSAKS